MLASGRVHFFFLTDREYRGEALALFVMCCACVGSEGTQNIFTPGFVLESKCWQVKNGKFHPRITAEYIANQSDPKKQTALDEKKGDFPNPILV